MEQEEIEEERIEAPLNDQNQLEVRKYFESNSTWTNIKKGPLGVALYMFATYSRVIFDRIILRSKLNETWTAWQETSVRTVKWSLDAPLDRVRKNSRFVGQVLQNSCPEPVEKLVGVPKVKGCWIGRKTWKGRKTEAVVMYIHGGAYVANSPIGFPPLCYLLRTLRRRYKKNVSIFAVDYPLSPESQYPEPIDAAERAYRWLVKKSGVDGRNNIILCGDSAGGGIVLGLLQRLYQQNNTSSGSFTIPNIYLSGVVLVSPWVELSCESVTHFTNAKYDFIPQHFWPLAAEYYLFGSQLNQQNQEKEWKRNPREEKSIDAKTKVSQWLQGIETSPLLNVVENEESNPVILDDLDNDTSAVASSPYRKQDDKQKRKIKATVYQDPAVSPMHTSHELLALYPPMLITYGGKEMFKDDIEFFIRRCLEAKSTLTDNISETMMSTSNYSNEQLHLMYGQHPDIEVEMDREMVHNYPWLPQIFDKHARDGLDRIAEFIATRITKPIQSQTSSSPASLLKGQSRPSTLSNTTLRTKSQWSGLPQEHVAHGTARADKVLSLLINDLAETPNSRRILPIH